MKSAQLGSAACDGQMATSTWKYKWVCTRRESRDLADGCHVPWAWTGDAGGGGSALSSHPAEVVLVCSTSRSQSCLAPVGINSIPSVEAAFELPSKIHSFKESCPCHN